MASPSALGRTFPSLVPEHAAAARTVSAGSPLLPLGGGTGGSVTAPSTSDVAPFPPISPMTRRPVAPGTLSRSYSGAALEGRTQVSSPLRPAPSQVQKRPPVNFKSAWVDTRATKSPHAAAKGSPAGKAAAPKGVDDDDDVGAAEFMLSPDLRLQVRSGAEVVSIVAPDDSDDSGSEDGEGEGGTRDVSQSARVRFAGDGPGGAEEKRVAKRRYRPDTRLSSGGPARVPVPYPRDYPGSSIHDAPPPLSFSLRRSLSSRGTEGLSATMGGIVQLDSTLSDGASVSSGAGPGVAHYTGSSGAAAVRVDLDAMFRTSEMSVLIQASQMRSEYKFVEARDFRTTRDPAAPTVLEGVRKSRAAPPKDTSFTASRPMLTGIQHLFPSKSKQLEEQQTAQLLRSGEYDVEMSRFGDRPMLKALHVKFPGGPPAPQSPPHTPTQEEMAFYTHDRRLMEDPIGLQGGNLPNWRRVEDGFAGASDEPDPTATQKQLHVSRMGAFGLTAYVAHVWHVLWRVWRGCRRRCGGVPDVGDCRLVCVAVAALLRWSAT
jgi:hypothetical protein